MKLSIVSTSISVFMTLILVSTKHYVKEILDAFTAPGRDMVNGLQRVAGKMVLRHLLSYR